MEVVIDKQARIGIVISEAPDKVALLKLDDGGAVVLVLHPTEWPEDRPDVPAAQRRMWTFREYFKGCMRDPKTRYPVDAAARKLLAGINPKVTPTFGPGALDALVECLPHGLINLFTPQGGFVGRFEEVGDAKLIARCMQERALLFENVDDLKAMDKADLITLQAHIDPNFKWAITPKKQYQEILDMAGKKTKAAPRKVASAQASRKRADGPVAQARALFDKMKAAKATRGAMIAACIAAGINKSTANTQYGHWRKETNYQAPAEVKADKPAKKKEAAKAETKSGSKPKKKSAAASKPAAKPAAKKKSAKKKAAPKPAAPAGDPDGDAADKNAAAGQTTGVSDPVADSQQAGAAAGGTDGAGTAG